MDQPKRNKNILWPFPFYFRQACNAKITRGGHESNWTICRTLRYSIQYCPICCLLCFSLVGKVTQRVKGIERERERERERARKEDLKDIPSIHTSVLSLKYQRSVAKKRPVHGLLSWWSPHATPHREWETVRNIFWIVDNCVSVVESIRAGNYKLILIEMVLLGKNNKREFWGWGTIWRKKIEHALFCS